MEEQMSAASDAVVAAAPSGQTGDGSVGPRQRAARVRRGVGHGGGAALTLGALGVVFGDIGTSPIYAMQTVFTADNHAVGTGRAEVYGIVSLVFWAVVLVVSVKYLTFILRADNGGEGGIMTLTALLQKQHFKTARTKIVLVSLGIFGAQLTSLKRESLVQRFARRRDLVDRAGEVSGWSFSRLRCRFGGPRLGDSGLLNVDCFLDWVGLKAGGGHGCLVGVRDGYGPGVSCSV